LDHRDDPWVDEDLHNPTKMEPGVVIFDSEMESRSSTEVKAIMEAELPAFLLGGWYRRPPSHHSLFRTSLVRVVRDSLVRRRKVSLDLILLGMISVQWWLMGLWIDYRVKTGRQRRWIRAAAVITLAEVIAAELAQLSGIPELMAAISLLLALLTWHALFTMFAGTGIGAVARNDSTLAGQSLTLKSEPLTASPLTIS
jgi:hypothetical protein